LLTFQFCQDWEFGAMKTQHSGKDEKSGAAKRENPGECVKVL
jgi:hypothetical protein